MTAGRIRRIKQFIGGDSEFLLTYGMAWVISILPAALAFHRKHGKHLTVTAVRPPGRFGELAIGAGELFVNSMKNPGRRGTDQRRFFVASRAIFDYLDENADTSCLSKIPSKASHAKGS